jgi:KDO2-lipid IV(A) lauroyltransferase
LAKKVSQINNPVFEWRWLSPRYWLLWLSLGLLWLVVQLPYPILYLLGQGIGRLFWLFAKKRRYIAVRNLELCFPEKSPTQRHRILLESFDSLGMAMLEMGMAWWWPDRRLKKIFSISGLQHIGESQEQGVMLLGMHFTTLDIGGSCLSCYHDYGAMYRPHRNPLFNYIQFRGRSRTAFKKPGEALKLFPREDLRTMVRLLREGELVWYAPDQDYGAQYSVFAPFFGISAATITATAKLATVGRAKVIPFIHRRLPWARGYEITLYPPLENYPEGDDYADAARINAVLEHHIRQQPSQYLWPHRRFKSRPAGESSLYPGLKN